MKPTKSTNPEHGKLYYTNAFWEEILYENIK
jgi:hypothetical protein